MKRLLLLLAALAMVLAVAAGCSQQQGSEGKTDDSGYQQISQEEAAALMKSESDYVLLDVRTPQEFAESHIPGAICIPNEKITGEAMLPQLPEKDKLILVYCRSGNRSKQAAEKLVKAGYTNVKEFGGIIDWTGAVE